MTTAQCTRIPANAFSDMNISTDKNYQLTDILLTNQQFDLQVNEETEASVQFTIQPLDSYVFSLKEK
jgi:hypothetical protein